MASGAADGEIRIWDCPSRKALRILNSHHGAIRGLSFDRTGTKLVSCSDDRSIRIWNVPEAKLGEIGSEDKAGGTSSAYYHGESCIETWTVTGARICLPRLGTAWIYGI